MSKFCKYHNIIIYPSLWRSSRVTALHAAVAGSIPGSVGNVNKKGFLLETRMDAEEGPQSLVSVPNTPGSNPKPLLCAHDVKADVYC